MSHHAYDLLVDDLSDFGRELWQGFLVGGRPICFTRQHLGSISGAPRSAGEDVREGEQRGRARHGRFSRGRKM